ncbi:Hypothetical predicted protein [Olea europaea subsp. europaea]|uniref:Uncharacterized protein n=1 Tax=Olea europaea subsp. europaea TaxID=158383 RepID=A0A8S0SYN3_OLEEU|nr:Hypothetical predicted protein [Olea europaea subsp. europaea]
MRGEEKLKTYKSKPRLGRDDESELSREVLYPPMDTHKNRSNPLVTETQVQQLRNMNNQTEIEIDSHVSNSNNAQHPIVHQGNEVSADATDIEVYIAIEEGYGIGIVLQI